MSKLSDHRQGAQNNQPCFTMVDYAYSSQLNLWQFEDPETLVCCRSLANLKAREYLFNRATSQDDNSTGHIPKLSSLPVEQFACGFTRSDQGDDVDYSTQGPLSSPNGNHYLNPEEEEILVSFYVSKLPSLVGPQAPIVRCRRESKVAATAAILTRRFFLSNSVMIHDPKSIMVAAAFLAAKVEDATMDIRYLEEGTAYMNSAVSKDEIIPAEIALLTGTHFDLLCFHPIKSVLAVTEDLRTYLKSDQGRGLVSKAAALRVTPSETALERTSVVVSGQDLKPMYDTARSLLDDVIVSDLPLLFNPGQVGLAALMVAQDVVLESQPQLYLPRIDLEGYIRQRFVNDDDLEGMLSTLQSICNMMRELKDGKWGCGRLSDMLKLKAIHKKLKKVRAWSIKEESSKSTKKRDAYVDSAEGPSKKKLKTDA
jgi:cyclin H